MEGMSLLEKLRTAVQLVTMLFSLVFLVIAPIELYAVYRVRHWQPVQARIVAAETKRIHWRGLQEVASYTFKDLETGAEISTGDVRPGDLPFSFSFFNSYTWSSERADIARYRQQASIRVYRSPNGKDYFLEQGSYSFMAIVFAVCLIYWGWLLTHLKPKPQK